MRSEDDESLDGEYTMEERSAVHRHRAKKTSSLGPVSMPILVRILKPQEAVRSADLDSIPVPVLFTTKGNLVML
jgi:hypothetical protein